MIPRSRNQLLVSGIGYILCVLACGYVVALAASDTAKLIYWLRSPFGHIEFPDIVGFYARNWLLFNLISGIILGATVYLVWRNAIGTFVWVPSFCILCQKILTRPHSIFGPSSFGSDAFYFLSPGCQEISASYISQRCADQVNYSLPFYAAVGLSAGTFLSMLYWKRKKRFVELSRSPRPSDDSPNPVDDHHQFPNNHRASEEE
jgi:hypothetical protein